MPKPVQPMDTYNSVREEGQRDLSLHPGESEWEEWRDLVRIWQG